MILYKKPKKFQLGGITPEMQEKARRAVRRPATTSSKPIVIDGDIVPQWHTFESEPTALDRAAETVTGVVKDVANDFSTGLDQIYDFGSKAANQIRKRGILGTAKDFIEMRNEQIRRGLEGYE